MAEQYLVDCAYDYSTDDGFDAQGCAGAWPQAYLEYLVKESKGQHQMEANYPYTAQDGTCSAQGKVKVFLEEPKNLPKIQKKLRRYISGISRFLHVWVPDGARWCKMVQDGAR